MICAFSSADWLFQKRLGDRVGRRAAEQVWKCSRAAVNDLRTQAMGLGIAAQLHSRPSLYLAGDVLNAAGLRREVLARQRLGLPSEFLDRGALRRHFGINRSAAILSHGNAEADPVALATGFLKQALRRGARFRAPYEVTDLHTSRTGVTLFSRGRYSDHWRDPGLPALLCRFGVRWKRNYILDVGRVTLTRRDTRQTQFRRTSFRI